MASSLQSTLLGPESLPLFKLSFCTAATLHSKMTWTHLPHDHSIFAVFDQVRKTGLGGRVSEKKILKLVHGADLFDQIDLDDLVFQVRLDEERMRSQVLQDADLYVIIIIKKPLVAIRYRLPDGQVRRIQMNFRPESGYDIAVRQLAASGLPIRDKNVPPGSLVSEPNASGYLPSSSLRPSPLHTPSQSQERVPRNHYHLDSGMQYNQSSYGQAVSSFAAQSPTTIGAAAALNRPATSIDWNPFMYNPARPTLLPSPDFVVRAATSDGSIMRPPSSAPEMQADRPMTAPLSLSQMLPPKRELPFPKKKDKAKAIPKEPEEQPLLSSSDPLQRTITPPAPAKQRKSRAKPKNPNLPVASSAPNGKAKASEPEYRSSQPETSSAPTLVESIYEPSSAAHETSTSDKQSEAHIPTSDTLVPSSPPPSAKNGSSTAPKKAPKQASKTAASKKKAQEQGPKIFEDAAPNEIMDRLDHWVRRYQDLPIPQRPETASENLAAYAAQPEETRMAVIDDMIVECLGDENFVKLVEDVEKSWKRIGLGF